MNLLLKLLFIVVQQIDMLPMFQLFFTNIIDSTRIDIIHNVITTESQTHIAQELRNTFYTCKFHVL